MGTLTPGQRAAFLVVVGVVLLGFAGPSFADALSSETRYQYTAYRVDLAGDEYSMVDTTDGTELPFEYVDERIVCLSDRERICEFERLAFEQDHEVFPSPERYEYVYLDGTFYRPGGEEYEPVSSREALTTLAEETGSPSRLERRAITDSPVSTDRKLTTGRVFRSDGEFYTISLAATRAESGLCVRTLPAEGGSEDDGFCDRAGAVDRLLALLTSAVPGILGVVAIVDGVQRLRSLRRSETETSHS